MSTQYIQKRRILIITLYIVLQVCVSVEGLYQLEVTIFGYDNPTGRCQECGNNRGCCDRFGSTSCSGSDRCDSYFNYCLRTLGSTERGCTYFGNQRSESNTDDRPLNFSQNMVLGLENPTTLRGLTNTYMGVQLYIEITDDDSDINNNDDDLIDVLLIDHNLPIGQPSLRQNYTGIYDINFVMMDLSIVARCVENFQGPNCSRCISGFVGTTCNVSINECTTICSGRGQCLDGVPSIICDCDPGFTGAMCEINIDDCMNVNCSGNGRCVDGVLSYTCVCDLGFTGAECDVNIDDCVAVDCSGNGQCMDGVHTYTCECDPGFTGVECGINIDDCVGENCSGNGQCVDGIDSFSCNCNASFTGPLCETRASNSEAERFSATFIGGILGAILSFALLLALLIILVISIVMYKKHKQAKKERIKTVRHEVPTVSVRYTKPPSHNTEEDITRKFDNPIYGTDENDKVKERAREVNKRVDQSRLLSMSLPHHEFDNPIYATEEPENAYSLITDASTQDDDETNQQLQATYESIDDGQLPGSHRPLVNGAFGH